MPQFKSGWCLQCPQGVSLWDVYFYLFTLHSSLPKGYAVIFGNEVKGVKQNIVDMSDGCLEIPQFGTKHSLNVSVTAGIVVWEFAKLLKL